MLKDDLSLVFQNLIVPSSAVLNDLDASIFQADPRWKLYSPLKSISIDVISSESLAEYIEAFIYMWGVQ